MSAAALTVRAHRVVTPDCGAQEESEDAGRPHDTAPGRHRYDGSYVPSGA
jgi:hypothetical protein